MWTTHSSTGPLLWGVEEAGEGGVTCDEVVGDRGVMWEGEFEEVVIGGEDE